MATGLTQARLRELLDYDPETGVFTRKVCVANVAAGTIAGCRKKDSGYVVISIDDTIYRAHLLAWLYMTGSWPERFVDHRDLNKSNNRWRNLRLATKSQNQANIGLTKGNASGLKGVSRYRAGERYGKPWQSGIRKDGKSIHLGHYATKEEAAHAYMLAAAKLFGEFARAA